MDEMFAADIARENDTLKREVINLRNRLEEIEINPNSLCFCNKCKAILQHGRECKVCKLRAELESMTKERDELMKFCIYSNVCPVCGGNKLFVNPEKKMCPPCWEDATEAERKKS